MLGMPTVPRLIELVARHDGVPGWRATLRHGENVVEAYARAGWDITRWRQVQTTPTGFRLVADVQPSRSPGRPGALGAHSGRAAVDPGLDENDIAGAHRHQRAASYAVITSDRGVLLTQLSQRTNAAGQWNLPGGGIDPGEGPLTALHREVHEETGQRIDRVRFVDVVTGHWVGRAPSGRVEDYHAIRLIHTARCPEPTDPVVHDVGGSTAAAAWVPVADLADVPIAPTIAEVLDLLVTRD